MTRLLLAFSALLFSACGNAKTETTTSTVEAPSLTVEEPAESPRPPSEIAMNEDVAADDAVPAPEKWTVDKKTSRIEFTGTQTGKSFTGSFSSFDITITFDPDNLESSRIKATIDTASARTGDKQRDDALPTKDWFSAESFPAAVFESSDIRAAGAGYEAKGVLTLRGVSRDLTLPFSLDISGDRAVADGSVSLIRSDFGVGQGEFATGEWVGLDVKVAIHVEADR